MSQPSVVDILKQLPKNNCRECGFPTCVAFAAMVTQGRAEHSQCPHIEHDALGLEENPVAPKEPDVDEMRDEFMEQLKGRVHDVDFNDAAERLGGVVSNERLVFRVLGKRFELDKAGDLHSDCHINSWVHVPILSYTIDGAGREPTGEWVRFGDLKHTPDWRPFFSYKCEKGLQDIAEQDPDLFFDAMDMFVAGEAEPHAGEVVETADYIALLHPLPKVPMLIAFWKPEDEFDAGFTLLFDRSAETNLGAESIYLLVMGLVEMLKRITASHGFR